MSKAIGQRRAQARTTSALASRRSRSSTTVCGTSSVPKRRAKLGKMLPKRVASGAAISSLGSARAGAYQDLGAQPRLSDAGFAGFAECDRGGASTVKGSTRTRRDRRSRRLPLDVVAAREGLRRAVRRWSTRTAATAGVSLEGRHRMPI